MSVRRFTSWGRTSFLTFIGLLLVAAPACGSGGSDKVLYIGGIPDQDLSVLQSRFGSLAEYLGEKTGVKVKYIPSVSYAAVVTAFRQGDIQMAWYGGLTGVQARLAVPDAQAIAQRPEDERFHSVFIKQKGLDIDVLEDLKGKSITFGSESSTSGYLMPLFFLTEAGIDPERDFKAKNLSGSHDKTWKLVESGAYQAGALNANIWEARLKAGKVKTSKVEAFHTTPAYYDYHWVVRGDLDETFGEGTTENIRNALLEINAASGEREQKILEAFQAERFIPTTNDNYKAIEKVGRQLGVIE